MKKIIVSVLTSLILSCNLNAASYILKVPEGIILDKETYAGLSLKNGSKVTVFNKEGLKFYLDKPINDVAVQLPDRILLFKRDSISLDKLLEKEPKTKINKKEFKGLYEAFPIEPSGISRMFKIVAPYGIKIAPSALMFGAPISVALVSQGIITDVIIGKKEKRSIKELKLKLDEQELRISNLEKQLRKENNEVVK